MATLRALWRFLLAFSRAFARASGWRVAAFRLQVRRHAGVALALALLVAVGGLTLRAAGGRDVTATSTPPVVARQALAADSGTPLPTVTQGATATAIATSQPTTQATATDTPAPSPTTTSQPTATSAPAATATSVPPTPTAPPTATPVPSWHTIGTYSGSSAQTLYTFDAQYDTDQVQLVWTCQVTQAQPSWSFGFTAPQIGGGTQCQAGNTSGVWGANTVTGSSYPVAITDAAGGAWTVTLQVYY